MASSDEEQALILQRFKDGDLVYVVNGAGWSVIRGDPKFRQCMSYPGDYDQGKSPEDDGYTEVIVLWTCYSLKLLKNVIAFDIEVFQPDAVDQW